MQDKRQLKISFSHTGTLNVMRLLVPSERITSVLNMGTTGIDLSMHDTSDHDLLTLIRGAQAELVERGVKPAIINSLKVKPLVQEAPKKEVVA